MMKKIMLQINQKFVNKKTSLKTIVIVLFYIVYIIKQLARLSTIDHAIKHVKHDKIL